jgi:MFS family permease
MVGALGAGGVADCIGRRPTLLGSAVVFVVGVLTAALSPSLDVLIASFSSSLSPSATVPDRRVGHRRGGAAAPARIAGEASTPAGSDGSLALQGREEERRGDSVATGYRLSGCGTHSSDER